MLAAAPALAADPVAGARYAGETSQRQPRASSSASADGEPRREGAHPVPRGQLRERREQGARAASGRPASPIADGAFERTGKEVEKLPKQGALQRRHADRALHRPRPLPDGRARQGQAEGARRDPRQAGNTISTCKHDKRITWAADRLGVGPETEEQPQARRSPADHGAAVGRALAVRDRTLARAHAATVSAR